MLPTTTLTVQGEPTQIKRGGVQESEHRLENAEKAEKWTVCTKAEIIRNSKLLSSQANQTWEWKEKVDILENTLICLLSS